jgi:hypothetical protein
MELPTVSSLEFEQLKSSIKTFIKTKTDFQDYDFEGSNLSMLVDILAYNTLYTSYNVSMSANELNLDTAVLRDNVVSIAKRLGYNPSSYTSSKVNLNITIDNVENYDSVIISPGPILSSSLDGKNYTFILRDRLELDVRGKTSVTFIDIETLEGSDFSITYTVDESNEHQRFFIPNSFVDVQSIRAFVISDSTANIEEEYERKTTIVDVTAESKIFFVEEVQDQKYEVIFGDDVFGRKVRDSEIIRIQYVISSGSESNNIKNFNFIGKVYGRLGSNENLINLSNISYELITDFSDGGSEFESIRSIKYAAPRYYSSQERAVTTSDYESIIRQIYPNTDLVNVIGGESLTPTRFGEIYITVKPKVGEKISNTEKERILNELKKYQVGSITTSILDPSTIDVRVKIYIIYDGSKTRKSFSDFTSLTNQILLDYAKLPSFNSFGGKFSTSDLTCTLKDLDVAIEFAHINVYLQKQIKLSKVKPGDTEIGYTINFNTKLKPNSVSPFYILSSPFSVIGYALPVFLGAFGNCDTSGDLNLYTINGQYLDTVGSVNNSTGEIQFNISPIVDDTINISVIPDITEIIFGPNIVPNLVVDDIIVDTKNFSDYLNPDNNTLPIENILSKMPSIIGDPNTLGTSTTTTTESPDDSNLIIQDSSGNTFIIPRPTQQTGGSTPIRIPTQPIPSVIPAGIENDPSGGTDPNNIVTIDNFTPESDPTVCS